MTLVYRPDQKERTHFERLLQRLEQDVLRMGALVEEAFRLGHNCLFKQHLQAATQLITLDKEIDRYYRQIELDCSTILSLKAPVGQDVRMISAFMQLVRDLERIADYAQNLANMAVKLMPYPPYGCMDEVAEMSRHAQLMLSTSLVALAELDAMAGAHVQELDDQVDTGYEKVYAYLANQRDIVTSVEPLLLLTLIIRDIERMADHATNIAQRVSYIVTGQRG